MCVDFCFICTEEAVALNRLNFTLSLQLLIFNQYLFFSLLKLWGYFVLQTHRTVLAEIGLLCYCWLYCFVELVCTKIDILRSYPQVWLCNLLYRNKSLLYHTCASNTKLSKALSSTSLHSLTQYISGKIDGLPEMPFLSFSTSFSYQLSSAPSALFSSQKFSLPHHIESLDACMEH
jgi:hypothetical protein